MNGELSFGLPPLLTRGNRILRADTMSTVLLRGINRSGLEYSEPSSAGFLAGAQMSRQEIGVIVEDWHANVIRIPFNQDWCLNGRGGHGPEAYLASLDQVIAWAAELGAYTILDLQWFDTETAFGTTHTPGRNRAVNHVPPAPNALSIELWRILASRYQGEPAVLFDLLNEPHHRLKDDPCPLHLIGEGGRVVATHQLHFSAREWGRWAGYLVAEIRRIRPSGLILVAGVDWAFDLSGIRLDAPDIVYSAHIYGNRSRHSWPKAIGRHREVPIFVGEWGGTDQDLRFGASLAEQLLRLGLGWAAWSWADFPPLVISPRAPEFKPTPFGALVQSQLRA